MCIIRTVSKVHPAVAAAGALVLFVIGGVVWTNLSERALDRRRVECRALAHALDKTVRAKSPRVFEGIIESRWDADAGRCYASLEYHYTPCTKEQKKKKDDLACSGPDADVAVYVFRDRGAKPLYICEREYATGAAACTETVYGADGAVLSTKELPPDQFPALKDALLKGPSKS